jgi:hypothetical protein
LNSPVLFLIFNRPNTTARVFEAIRKAQPPKLFIAADGPREDHDEADLCTKTRAIATNVDWPCQVHTLFRDTNLGCGPSVSQSISWFFEHNEQGIILEDDCLPDNSFFDFCDILLAKYASQKNVMSISGTNLLPNGWKKGTQSYHFGHGGIWGWATWKRAWELFDFDMSDWNDKGQEAKIKKAMNNDNWFYYYLGMMQSVYNNTLNTWDVQWFYSILKHQALAINPSVNLVKNIGFGADATNTFDPESGYANLSLNEMKFPLKHPSEIKADKKYLRAIYRRIKTYKLSFKSTIKFWAKLHLARLSN